MKGGGSLTKLDNGTWRARLTVDGKRHSRTFPLRRDAVAWLNDAKAKAAQGGFITPDRLRTAVNARLDAWLAEKQSHPTLADNTKVKYEYVVRLHVRPYMGRLTMEQVNAETIRQWQYQLAEDTSTAVAAGAYGIFGAFLSAQVTDGYLVQHPYTRVRKSDKVSHKPRRMTVLEPHELRAVVDALADGPVERDADHREVRAAWRQDVVLGLVFVGCRFGDLARLRPADWDRVNGRLFVRDQKTGNDRWLPVFDELRSVLERCVLRGGEYLFMTDGQHGQGRLTAGSFAKRHFKPALDKARITRTVRLHDLRHTTASLLIAKGFGPVQVAAYLGHSNPKTTMTVYAHLFSDDFADMGAALNTMYQQAQRLGDNVTPLREVK